jgi:hypothetical protein
MSLSPTRTYQIRPTQVSVVSVVTDAVTANDVKLMLPVYDNQSALIIARLIKSVQRRVEDFIDIDSTLRVRKALWQDPARTIELPYGTHGDIISVERYANGVWAEYEDYELEGLDYKSIVLDDIGAPIRVEFQSGVDTNEQLNQAILQEVAWQFKNRNDPNQAAAEVRAGLSVSTINILTGVVR